MKEDTKKYRLLKDIDSPDLKAKAGDIGKLGAANKVWFDNGRYFFYKDTVESTSRKDWFEEVLPEQSKSLSLPHPETKYMSAFEAYTSGVAYGISFCKKYGIPDDLSEIISESKPSTPTPTTSKEQGWEILSFKDYKNENEYYTQWINDPCLYSNGIKAIFYSAKVLIEKNYSIHSVKRLSDGVVFSIGDDIQHDIFPSQVPYKINGFKISDIGSDKGTLYFCGEYPVTFKFPSTWPIKKVAQPFSTEDKGKDREEIKLPLSQIKHLYDLWGSLKTGKPFMEFVYSRVIF